VIIDCFPYFNEKELLELRINLLKDVVDRFIIIEADRTHTGNKKDFTCVKTIKELDIDCNKITVLELNLPSKEQERNNWVRERAQRNAVKDLINYDDTVIISDCDEIVDPQMIKKFAALLKSNPNGILRIPMYFLMGRADLEVYDEGSPAIWHASYMCMRHHLEKYTASEIREAFTDNPSDIVYNTFYYDGDPYKKFGWHFTWMGDNNVRKLKYQSFMHYDDVITNAVENNNNKSMMMEFIDSYIPRAGEGDPLGRQSHRLMPFDTNKLPSLIFENQNIKNYLFSQRSDAAQITAPTKKESLLDILNRSPASKSDKGTVHSYLEFYENEFQKVRNKQINFLEIGIQTGSSMFLWKEFFKNAQIVGIDNTDSHLLPEYSSKKEDFKNVLYIFEDAYQEKVARILPEFDIIIDDGPHSLESQKKFIELYLSKLKSGGVMIIEDLQDISWAHELLSTVPDQFKENCEVLDLRSNKNRYDDILFIIRK
jgi:hypothetical protein